MADTNHQATQQDAKENPALSRLSILIGTWRTEITFPSDLSTVIPGQTSIEWLAEGRFLVVRGSVEHHDFPTGFSIIGADDVTGAYPMLYFDSRGVARIYQMSLENQVWKLWREAPEFSQRFEGAISSDGNTIEGFWEASTDGSNWQRDFNLAYKKVGQSQG